MADISDQYLSGAKLYGDDLTPAELQTWIEEERAGYSYLSEHVWRDQQGQASLHDKQSDRADGYAYHELNRFHGFGFLPKRYFNRILGIGSGNGNELLPVIDRAGHITILESSTACTSSEVQGVPVEYVNSKFDGDLPFPQEMFDMVVCFSALQHIPNVSRVLKECYRCLKPGGFALIREPIISMGDWRKPRPGLTKNTRGIPVRLFREMLASAGFTVIREKKCMFSPMRFLARLSGASIYNQKAMVLLDSAFSSLFAWNETYNPRTLIQKIRPASIFYVLYKK